MIVYTVEQFLEKLEYARQKSTVYALGGIGYPMTDANKRRLIAAHDYNAQRYNILMACTHETFAFDCVNLGKGILWGWTGDTRDAYGGARFGANGVPDVNETTMYNSYCYDKSTDFSNIVPGEFVWFKGHCGYYKGGGIVIECTPAWADGVQYTNLGNIGISDPALPTRKWYGHGKLPWIDYAAKKNGVVIENGVMVLYKNGVQIVDAGEHLVDGWHYVDEGGVVAHDKDVWIPYVFRDEDKWNDEEKKKIAFDVGGKKYGEFLYMCMKEKTGKWCRYDHDGNIVYGPSYSKAKGGFSYFEPATGAMLKGEIAVEMSCVFDAKTGILKNLYYAD